MEDHSSILEMVEGEPKREFSMLKKAFQYSIFVTPFFQPCPNCGCLKIVEAPAHSAFRSNPFSKTPHTGDRASLDRCGWWTKNTPKPDFFEKRKNHLKCENSKMSRNMPKLAIRSLTRGL